MSSDSRPLVDRPSFPRGEIRALTGLRLVAALVVVIGHFRPILFPYLDQLALLRPILDAGWLGVEVFFVLSGFVIARSYIEEVGGRFTVAKAATFVFNRFARVWPVWALLTTLMAGWILAVRWKGANADVWLLHPEVSPTAYLEQLSMTQMWGVDSIVGPSYVMPGWSISAEWLAYLAFPLLAVVLLPLRRLPPAVLLALATLLMTPMAVTAYLDGPLDPEVPWLYRLACSFVAGMLVAIGTLGLQRTRRVEQFAFALSLACTLMFVVLCFWASWRRAGDTAHDYAGVSVFLFPALVGALSLTDRGPAAWLSRDLVVYGGRISYCLYLVHFPVFDVLLTVVWQGQDPALRVVTPGLALVAPFAIAGSVLLSMALHHGVEVPARALLLRGRSRVVERLARRRPVPAGPPPATDVIPLPRGTGAVHAAGARGARALPAVPSRVRSRETVGPRS